MVCDMKCSCPVLLLLALLFATAGAFAAEIDTPPSSGLKEPLVHHDQPGCARWSDDCVICARDPAGGPPLCSNIGVACQPQAIRCLAPLLPDPAPAPAK